MRRPKSRRSPERIAVVWAPFLLGAALAAFAGDAPALVLANLGVGLVVAVGLAGSRRTTGRLFALAPRLGAAVLALTGAILVALAVLDG